MGKEFRAFALRGNVVDLAVGIIIGSAFGAIVNSLVNDLLMPPIGLLLGKVDFSNLFITLQAGDPDQTRHRSGVNPTRAECGAVPHRPPPVVRVYVRRDHPGRAIEVSA